MRVAIFFADPQMAEPTANSKIPLMTMGFLPNISARFPLSKIVEEDDKEYAEAIHVKSCPFNECTMVGPAVPIPPCLLYEKEASYWKTKVFTRSSADNSVTEQSATNMSQKRASRTNSISTAVGFAISTAVGSAVSAGVGSMISISVSISFVGFELSTVASFGFSWMGELGSRTLDSESTILEEQGAQNRSVRRICA